MKRLSTHLIPLAAVAAYFATAVDPALARGYWSDERLKRDVAPVEGALARLSQIETR